MAEGRPTVNYAGLAQRDGQHPRRANPYRHLAGPPDGTRDDPYEHNSPGIRPPFPVPRTPVPVKSPL